MRKVKQLLYIWLSLALILGSYRGYLALWAEDSQIPVQVYPYKIESFPPQETEKLNAGIRIRDEAHLRSLLQDYLS